ncbi:MAG: hypothetical protein GY793_08535 [Proteobacteria bacterium]|nr:hypothetical protein [Pseudomonadota bacterium]
MMDVQTIETVLDIAQDTNTQETLKMIVGLGGTLFGGSFMAAASIIGTGIGITFTILSTVASQICAVTETKDTTFYKIVEVFARNTGKAKDETTTESK